MAQAVILPKLGQTMEEGAIVKWLKKPGDIIKKGDILFELETDKAALEVESFFEGILLAVIVGEGITVPVNTVVGYIGAKGEKIPDTPPPPPKTDTPKKIKASAQQAVQQPANQPDLSPAPATVAAVQAAPKPALPKIFRISPRAKALAAECVIDPHKITGSGPDGRVVEKDVVDYLAAKGYDKLKITPTAKELAHHEKLDILNIRGTGPSGKITVDDVKRAVREKPQPMSKMRQVIARRLTESFSSVPHFYVTVNVDMTDLLAYRKKLKNNGQDFTVTDFIFKAVILALLEYPQVNSSTDGATVSWHSTVNLGMAVSVSDGLVVPPIRNAQELSMEELHSQTQRLAVRAREGKLLPDEMSGSTFTVSNMGMLNVDNFNAIINPGESAILAVASTTPTPAVIDNEVKIRQMMKITLSADHRIVDGALGATFVNFIKNKLEDIELWNNLILS